MDFIHPEVQSGHTRRPAWYKSRLTAGNVPSALTGRLTGVVVTALLVRFAVRLAGRGALLPAAVLPAAADLVLRIVAISCWRVLSVVFML